MKFMVLTIALLAWAGGAIAQLQEYDTARWQLNANLSLRMNDGNVERLIMTPEFNVAHLPKKKQWGFSSRQRYTYGTFGTLRTENDLLSRNFVYWSPAGRVYPYLMVWFQTHARQQLDFRYQVGAGVTYTVLRKSQQIVKVSGTVTHEQNRYRAGGLTRVDNPQDKQYEVVRLTARVYGAHSFSQQVISLYYEFLFQSAIDNSDDWRLFAESGINTRITKSFAMRTYVNYEYQRVHIETQKPYDIVLNIGLNYQFPIKN